MDKIIQGDCIEVLKTLPDGIINTVITSPPYYGLRDYGIDGQFGLEETPEAYVGKLVELFREIRRVLRDDGTLWLNLGDSYTSSGIKSGVSNNTSSTLQGGKSTQTAASSVKGKFYYDTKPKDLIGIPWRVAFALQSDGWYLRQDIIWHKPNPMPESVTDRCTKSHEYIFLLSKSQKYYFDNEAIKENSEWSGDARAGYGRLHYRGKREGDKGTGQENFVMITEKRNKRSVWTVTTKPYSGAHFATFPPDLIEPCVLAGSPENGTVLDPFGGSGTTGGVAMKLNRKAILCELNQEYVGIMEQRIQEIVNEKKVEQIDPSQIDFFEEMT
jgi:DNA modification methylase